MVQIDILGKDDFIGDRLNDDLLQANRASIAVAFAKQSALDGLNLLPFCHGGGTLKLVAGLDFCLTELTLLQRVQGDCRVYHQLDNRARRTFHPKVYLFEKPDSLVAYIGSSNLTKGGLFQNIEANVRLEGSKDAPELLRAQSVFTELFESEFSAPLSPAVEARYLEMQQLQRQALSYAQPDRLVQDRLMAAEAMAVGDFRAKRGRPWLLVVSPDHFAVCMKHGCWGRQDEKEVRNYRPGDIGLFHVNEGRGIAAMVMFTGRSYWEDTQLWPVDKKKGRRFPWRIQFRVLGELRTGLPTKDVLQPLRQGAPARWFHGFIQKSHGLTPEDFGLLRATFEAALRDQLNFDLDTRG